MLHSNNTKRKMERQKDNASKIAIISNNMWYIRIQKDCYGFFSLLIKYLSRLMLCKQWRQTPLKIKYK